MKTTPGQGLPVAVLVVLLALVVRGEDVNATDPVPASSPTTPSTDLYLAYLALILMAVLPIWVGSIRALQSGEQSEQLTSNDAWMFPVYGSGALFGLYILFKLKFQEYLVPLLTAYFLMAGAFAVTGVLGDLLSALLPSVKLLRAPFKFTPPLIAKWTGSLEGATADLFMIVPTSALIYWYWTTRHWLANNAFGLAFSIQGIQLLDIGSYKNGVILLSLLFFYDIFWVFGTEVMVKVATSLDAPIKVVFPKNFIQMVMQQETPKFSMLGLGDIVIPGLFLALLLRYDRARHMRLQEASRAATASASPSLLEPPSGPAPTPDHLPPVTYSLQFPAPFFLVSFVAYIAGLLTTMGVMHIFQAAQPALLYLVPFCLLSSFFTAVRLGEMGELWNFSINKPKKE
jgi:minor histocompatibility antigen H13